VRFTAAHNAVLLGAYGLAPAHSAPSGLPATLHPILQAVDTRQVADRLVVFHAVTLTLILFKMLVLLELLQVTPVSKSKLLGIGETVLFTVSLNHRLHSS